MKILHVITDSNVGGAGILLKNLISALPSDDMSSEVIMPVGSALCPILSPVCPVRELSVCSDSSFHPLDFFKYKSAIADSGADIVHTHGATMARMAAKSLGKICVMTRHCAYPARLMSKFPMKQINGLTYGIYTDFCIATAEAARQNLISMGVDRGLIRVIINSSPQMIRTSDSENEALREALGVSGEFCVGMVARLEADKGQDVLIDAARMLRGEKIKFLIIGSGSCENALRERAGDLENVIFCGFTHNVYRYLNILDVLVNASRGTETSCLAISEAMSLGVPCIATPYGGNPHMVKKENGLLLSGYGAGELKRKILLLKNDTALMSRLRRGSLARYAREFTPERMAREYAQVYQTLYNKKS